MYIPSNTQHTHIHTRALFHLIVTHKTHVHAYAHRRAFAICKIRAHARMKRVDLYYIQYIYIYNV